MSDLMDCGQKLFPMRSILNESDSMFFYFFYFLFFFNLPKS